MANKLQKETLLRVIRRFPDLMRISRDYLQTDLQFHELLGLYIFFKDLNLREELHTWTLPGEFSGPYWRLHPREIEHLTEAYR